MATTATTGEAATGSAATQRRLSGTWARDFTTLEPKMAPLYEAALDEIGIRPGTTLLDVGCGPGLFLQLAAARGATVTGIDAAGPFIEIARERVPHADLTVGEMDSLPYPDDSFHVVTGFNVFHIAADPARALREARRVGHPGAAVLIATWGRPEQCDAADYVRAVGGLPPPPAHGAPGPFARFGAGALEDFAARGGLVPGARHEVLCTWAFPDQDALLRALRSTRFAVKAAERAGEARVGETALEALAPYRTGDGGYRLENVFAYLIATA
jgi:SAM-dependent methyltransferase